ncbi:cytochrome P450 [Catellatospora sp. TT07R-123]|uniref:cytochrome P450 family protein n=1 Tax=Catellatospora sp. TT07R-123 TaxID=2733863 RepID=UPI001AFCEAD3|nr:cytochrome P450 [Catellatospora sp. TT07R-123]GHJ44222.1 cytochrome P450 [Catellatospora sp. TT07R-123]
MEQLTCPHIIDRTGSDVHAEAAQIRANGPVSQIELPGGVLAWSIVGYEEAVQALADARFSKDPRQHWTAFRDGRIGQDFPLIGWALMDNMTTAYGADHSRLRRLTAKAFTTRRVEAMRPRVRAIIDGLLEELAAVEPGEVIDFKARYAHPFPSRVICELFGVPEERRAAMLRGGELNVDTTLTPEEVAANIEQWHTLMHQFVADKRREPGDDLTSDLLAAQEEDGSRLTDSELVGTLFLLLATGTEPVMNQLTNSVHVLLSHPEELARLRSGEITWSQVIEETLRMEAPVAHLPFRFPIEDVEVGGVVIPKGDPVLIGFAGIGRDPVKHGPTASEFDPTRSDKSHLSFGYGIYRCIGMPLAMLELELALPALFERFPGLELAVKSEEVEPQGTFIMNGRKELPVRLAGAAVQAA